MKTKLLFICLAFVLILTDIRSQVTIGSNLPPREGSLLDLKSDGKNGHEANAAKGLGLPRVELESLTALTIDEDIEKDDYVGLTVYNVTNNSELREGTYCWFGDAWKQVILVDSLGNEGSVLMNNGDNTYSWSEYSIPDFKFHKPTQTSAFDPQKAVVHTYPYRDIVSIIIEKNAYKPKEGLFNLDFVYTETLNVQTEETSLKYMLLELSVDISKRTVGNRTVRDAFWEEMKIEVLLGGVSRKEQVRIYSTAVNSRGDTTIDLFSVIPLENLGKGNYELKVRVSNLRNTYNANLGSTDGYFSSSYDDFYRIELKDFGLVLYEEK